MTQIPQIAHLKISIAEGVNLAHDRLLAASSSAQREELFGHFIESFSQLTLPHKNQFYEQRATTLQIGSEAAGHLRLGLKLLGDHAWRIAQRPAAADLPHLARSAMLILCQHPVSPDLNRLALILLAQTHGFKLVPEVSTAAVVAGVIPKSASQQRKRKLRSAQPAL